MGPRLKDVEDGRVPFFNSVTFPGFNGATSQGRGRLGVSRDSGEQDGDASMGPRLKDVEDQLTDFAGVPCRVASMGPRLKDVEDAQ